MRNPFRHIAFAALTAALISGQTMTALAISSDSEHGPGTTNPATEVTQEAPQGTGEANQDSGAQTDPLAPVGESAADTGTQTGETQTEGGQTAAETPAATNQAYLQLQLLRKDLTWTDPVVDDSVLSPGEGGFLSMCIYANNLPGDVIYRTYSSLGGWSGWAMNGGHTAWNADYPIEGVQIRLNGIFGNMFDVYYAATLSDGTVCDWSRNGGTNGAMASGRTITGLRLSLWGKGTEGASYKMDAPLVASATDGVQFVDGVPVYSNGTGEAFTGWGWNDRDRYYFVNNAAVVGWQYIDGYKYYFEADGKLVTDLEPYLNSQGPFMLRINKQMNCTTVYIKDGENGFIIPYKTFLCSTGDDTPLGDHRTPEMARYSRNPRPAARRRRWPDCFQRRC